MTDEPQPPDAAPLNTPHCSECNAALDPDQRYCLECGAPTSRAPRLATGNGARIVALALILLAVGTGALAVAVTRENHSSNTGGSGTSTTGTSTTATTGTQTGFETVTSGTSSIPSSSTPTSSTPTSSTPTSSTPTTSTPTTSTPTASSWPAGTQAWTVILASETSQADADNIAASATSDGLSAGVLYSSAVPTLSPGYWVVFSGQYATSAAAEAAAESARSDFPDAAAHYIPTAS